MGKKKNRDFIVLIFLLSLTVIGVIYNSFLFLDSFEDGEEVSIGYNEKSNLGYKVWLRDNDFYSSDYLNEDYDAVASSIKEIEIDFDYLMEMSDYVQGVSYYTINSRIEAYQSGDLSKRKIWDYEKIIKDKVITTYNDDSKIIENKDSFKINYREYKRLMDSYKANYGVSLVGNLIIEIDIMTELSYDKFNNGINFDKRTMNITIPLTESIVKITYNDIEDNSNVLVEKGNSRINYLKLTLSLLAYGIGLYLCIYMGVLSVKLVGIDSKFNKALKKILRTYGAIIVNITEIKLGKDIQQMEVSSFEELLDAQQELKKPILYWNVKKSNKIVFAMFVLKNGTEAFVYKMSSALYEVDTKKKSCDKNG